jgi:hydrogenase maturation protease
MTNARQRRIVVGIGNPDRGDDGAGWAVARELRSVRSVSISESDRGCERIPPFSTRGSAPQQAERRHSSPLDAGIIEHSGEATALLAHMEGAEQAFLIDACMSGAPPGTIHRFDVSSAAMPSLAPGFSTHGFGLTQALELARALGRLPRQTIVYAIEAASFAAGAPLSPEVAAAVAEVVRRLRAEIACSQSPISRAPGMVVL